MALVTRCPHCHTAFRVVLDQLRVRNGLVRCGVCETVFDGRACLEPVPGATDEAGAGGAPGAAAPSGPRPAAPDVPAPSRPLEPHVPATASVSPLPTRGVAAPELPRATMVAATPPAERPSSVPPAVSPAVLRGRRDPAGPRSGQWGGAAPAAQPPHDWPDDESLLDDDEDLPLPGDDEDLSRPGAVPLSRPVGAASGGPWDTHEPGHDGPPVATHPMQPGLDSSPWDDAEDRLPPTVLRGRADRPLRPVDDTSVIRAREPDDFPLRDDGEPRLAADPDGTGRLRTAHRSGEALSAGRDEPGLDLEAGPTHGDADAVYGETRMRYSRATDAGHAPPEFLDQDLIEAQRARRRGWAWACLAGVVVLALQLLFAYRTQIAIAAPSLRPLLAAACQPLGCSVGYARRIERIFIVSSSLHTPTGSAGQVEAGRSRLVLTVTLRNRYDKDQHWPMLALDLTDLSDTVVARRMISPEAYLSPAQAAGPMPAGAEVTVNVPIEVVGLQVNGYQLDKFFP